MTITQENGTMTVLLTGELDHHNAGNIRGKVDTALTKNTPDELILDFRGITFMDSSGVGLVLGRYKKTRNTGCRMVLTGLSERDERMMKMSGLKNLIEYR